MVNDNNAEPDETVILNLGIPNVNSFSIVQPDVAGRTVVIEDNDCNAGNVAPTINDNETNFCGGVDIQLDTYSPGARPPLTGLIWTTNEDEPLNQDFLDCS